MKARHLANLVSKGKAGRLVHRSQQVLAEQLLRGHPPAAGEDARTGEFRIDYHSGRPVVIDKKGYDLIHDPWFNKFTAFEPRERERLGLRGLLPPGYHTMDQQQQQFMDGYAAIEAQARGSSDVPLELEKWRYLSRLHDRDETLYYKVLIDNIQEMSKIVYTPTVSLVCERYMSLFRRPRGMFFSAQDKGEYASMVRNWPFDKVDLIVVTDGSSVLGLGDCGIQSIAIPIGKLDIYVAAAGISPKRVLPAVFDVGTDNETLRNNPMYLGLKHPRLDGDEYLSLMDEFIDAIVARWPSAIVQFDDFSPKWSRILMDRYKDKLCIFNDDIEATGSVAVAGIRNVLRAQKLPFSAIANMRIVLAGTSSTVEYVTAALREAMAHHLGGGQDAMAAAARNFWIVDDTGVLTEERASDCPPELRDYLRPDSEGLGGLDLDDVVEHVKPHVLFGLSDTPGRFTPEVLASLRNDEVARPAVFPWSFPAHHAECTAVDVFTNVGPNALFSATTEHPAVRFPDGQVGHTSRRTNMFLFPGIALGTIVSGAQVISDGMRRTAAKQLAEFMTESEVQNGVLYPQMSRIRDLTIHVAAAVARKAAEEGIAKPNGSLANKKLETMSEDEIRKVVERTMWYPSYPPLILMKDE